MSTSYGTSRTGQLPATEPAELRRMLDSAGFSDLPKATGSPDPDGVEYTIRYHGRHVVRGGERDRDAGRGNSRAGASTLPSAQ